MKNERLFWRLSGYFLMAALFLGLGGGILRAQDTYTLVTNAATLRDGDEVLIVGEGGHAMGVITEDSWGNKVRKGVEVTVADNAITNPTLATTANDVGRACAFTLEKNAAGSYAFKDKLNTQSPYLMDDYGDLGFSSSAAYFSITMDADGVAVIFDGSRYFRYYTGDNEFKFYSKATTQANVYLYKKSSGEPDPPYIASDKTEVSYKILPTANLHENLFFTAGNLTEDVTVSVASADAGRDEAVIIVSPEEIGATEAAEFDLTLTTSGLSIGTYKDIITLESGDAKVEITVNLEVKEMVIYQKVTDASTLKAGNVVLIASANGYAMTASISTDTKGMVDTREAVQVAIEGNAIIDPLIAAGANQKRACEFTLEKADGQWAFNDKLNTKKYLSSNAGSDEILPSSSTPFYFSVSIDADGVATIAPGNKTGRSIRYYADYSPGITSSEMFQLLNAYYGQNVSLYKKQIPDEPEPTCDAVTLPADGAATPGEDDVTLVWNAPATGAPANGYKVTVKGGSYNKSETVANTETQIDWAAELSPETEYTFEIVSLCEDDLASDPVTGTFTTLHATSPELKLASPSPANGAVLTGDVTFAFTTEDFDMNDENHLVKAEVKETKGTFEEQRDAPVLKRVYTQASPLTITGLTDGNYHIDLYMVEVKENEGKKDTAVVGFNGSNYLHRDIVVKRPAVYFSAQNLKITTFRGVEGSGKAKVTGWALPENATVSFASNSDKFTVTPATLTQAQVMATGGAEITVTYNGADATATAAITASCTGATSATLAVNAIARDTLANLKGLYSRVANDTVLVRGKMVVTHKDTSNNRVWVQDINKENGASMLLFQVTVAKGFTPLKVGDVLENFAGRVTVSNGLYRFTPLAKIEAVEQNHAVYVDTLTADDINNNFATVQSALVCVKDVAFAEKGNFAKATKYTLKQGTKNINFVAFNSADYVGKAIPTVHLYVVGVLSSNTTYGIYIASRKEADLVNAPCPLPADVTVDEVHSTEAALDWEGWPANYSVRYGTTQDLSGATPVAVATSHLKIENLVAETQYYYQIKSVCGTGGYESAWTDVADFTTLAAHAPTIAMNSPINRPVFTDSVKVSFRITNVTLKASDTSARIVFSDGVTVDNYTDTVYKRAMPSGNYSVQVILVKDGQPLTPGVHTNVRYFSVDLPDVAAPVFTPRAGRYKDSVEVTLNCATQEATIFYAKGAGEYTAYTEGEKIVIKETTTLKAYAAKERMDTSAESTAAYTIYSVLKPEGDLVFAENFSKSKTASTDAISNFDEITDMPGWSGANMYPEVGKIKGGTSSKAGKLVSPAIDLSYDNGKYYVAFFAQAYNNKADSTKIRLTAGDQTVLVSDLDKTEMSEYVYLFNNGTANTKITFEALAADYNRFFLDSIRVYQVLPPMIIAPATLRMTTVQGTPVSSVITVRGKLLESDVTVTCPDGNFTVTPATLDKEAVMSEAGVEITVTFNGEVLSDNVEITLVSGDLSKTLAVTATATSSSAIIVEPTLAMTTTQGTPVSEKVSVKGKYLEEDIAVICPDGNFTVSPVTLTKEAVMSEEGAELTVTFNGDKAADTVRLALVSGDLRKTITVTATAVPEPDGEITVVSTLTMSTVVLGIPVSEKVSVKGKYLKEDVTITCPDGNFTVSPATLDKEAVMSEDGAEFTVTFNGSVLSDNVTITLASGDVSKTIAVTATVDECEAPTQLKATVDNNNNVTLSWNGTAEQYRVLVMFGTTELRNELVNEKTYSLNNLEVGTYAWAVASICADGEQWTNGEAFEVKPDVANESSDELAYRIYPNPTAGVFYVETAESANMEIFTLGGVMVRNEMLKAGKNEIRLDRSGVYFVRLTNANASAVNRVIVR